MKRPDHVFLQSLLRIPCLNECLQRSNILGVILKTDIKGGDSSSLPSLDSTAALYYATKLDT